MDLLYRADQFWQILRAKALATDALRDVAAVLSEAELALFHQFAASDQWHSYRVYRTLQQAGHTQPDGGAAARCGQDTRAAVDLGAFVDCVGAEAAAGKGDRLGAGGTTWLETAVCGQGPTPGMGRDDGAAGRQQRAGSGIDSATPGSFAGNGRFRRG